MYTFVIREVRKSFLILKNHKDNAMPNTYLLKIIIGRIPEAHTNISLVFIS